MSLRSNVLWNLAGAGLPLLFGATLIPFLVRHVGVEALGVLTLIWALIGYFSLFDLGVGRALTQQVAQKLAEGRVADVPALVKVGLRVALALGAVGGIVLALAAEPLALRGLKVSPALHADVARALLVAAACVPLTTVMVGLRGVLEAYEDFRAVSLLRMCLGIATFGLPALSVLLVGPSLTGMVVALVAARLVVGIAHWVLVRRRLGASGFGGAAPSRRPQDLRRLLSFGVWMTVSNVISPLMVTADRFVISAVLGAAVVAYYTVPSEMMLRVLILPGALTGVLFPRLASLMASDIDTARRLYRKAVVLVATALLPICLALAFGAHWGLALWLGTDFADRSAPIVAVFAVGLLFNGVAFVPFAAVQAAGLARVTAQLHLVEAVFYVPLLLLGLHELGLVGAAVAWTARVGVDLVLLLFVARRQVFRAPAATPIGHNLPPPEPERP
jgi:O-antigen/teichoic acid export membrane protein